MSFEAEWARCAPWIEAALVRAGPTHRLSDVEAMVRSAEAQFWPGKQAAMITLVDEDPCERRLLIWLAGGCLAELVEQLRPSAEAWARAKGCRRLMIIGRAGWQRAMKAHGYAPVARLIAKEL